MTCLPRYDGDLSTRRSSAGVDATRRGSVAGKIILGREFSAVDIMMGYALQRDIMDRSTQRERAERFLHLHDGPDVLVVGSVWDPGSAVLFEREGFEAIATSSAGVAFSLGYPDGERVPRDEMLAAIARVVRATRLPVSADVEMGYGRSAREVSETCRGVLDVGGVPPVAELATLGVRRVSQGSGPAWAALATARRIARELCTRGTYTGYIADAISYADANRLFERGGAPRASS